MFQKRILETSYQFSGQYPTATQIPKLATHFGVHPNDICPKCGLIAGEWCPSFETGNYDRFTKKLKDYEVQVSHELRGGGYEWSRWITATTCRKCLRPLSTQKNVCHAKDVCGVCLWMECFFKRELRATPQWTVTPPGLMKMDLNTAKWWSIELECHHNSGFYNQNPLYAYPFGITEDGSIPGRNELVSPLYPVGHSWKFPTKEFKEQIRFSKPCGMHVHFKWIDRNHVKAMNILKTAYVYEDAMLQHMIPHRQGSQYCLPMTLDFNDFNFMDSENDTIALEAIWYKRKNNGSGRKDTNKSSGTRYRGLNLHAYFHYSFPIMNGMMLNDVEFRWVPSPYYDPEFEITGWARFFDEVFFRSTVTPPSIREIDRKMALEEKVEMMRGTSPQNAEFIDFMHSKYGSLPAHGEPVGAPFLFGVTAQPILGQPAASQVPRQQITATRHVMNNYLNAIDRAWER